MRTKSNITGKKKSVKKMGMTRVLFQDAEMRSRTDDETESVGKATKVKNARLLLERRRRIGGWTAVKGSRATLY